MHNRPATRDYFILLGLALIWGTSYVLIKWGLVVFSPVQVGVLRLSVSAIALAPLALSHLRRIRVGQLPLLVLVGLTGTALPTFLFPIAQTHLSSSLAGMLSGLTPLCTFLVAWLVFHTRPALQQGLGIALGLLGAAMLAYVAPSEQGESSQLAYAGLILIACLCYGLSSNLVANNFRGLSSLTITVVSFFLVGAPALLWTFTFSGIVPTALAAGSAGAWAVGYVSVLAVGSTVVATMIFYRLIQRTGAVFASTVSYLIPVVALGWGLLDGEAIGWLQLPAIGLVLLGVFLSKRT